MKRAVLFLAASLYLSGTVASARADTDVFRPEPPPPPPPPTIYCRTPEQQVTVAFQEAYRGGEVHDVAVQWYYTRYADEDHGRTTEPLGEMVRVLLGRTCRRGQDAGACTQLYITFTADFRGATLCELGGNAQSGRALPRTVHVVGISAR